MRNLLYVTGALFTILGALATIGARDGSGTEIVRMLAVLCGVVQIGCAAIIGAIDALRRALVNPSASAPPQR